eukprot:7530721-Pyramimonas_sp.AAC.1
MHDHCGCGLSPSSLLSMRRAGTRWRCADAGLALRDGLLEFVAARRPSFFLSSARAHQRGQSKADWSGAGDGETQMKQHATTKRALAHGKGQKPVL